MQKILTIAGLLIVLIVGTAFGQPDSIRGTARGITNHYVWVERWTPPDFGSAAEVTLPSRENTWWDNFVVGEPDPWDKLYDTDQLPVMGYWISFVDATDGRVDAQSIYKFNDALSSSGGHPSGNWVSRATLWIAAFPWADVYLNCTDDLGDYVGSTPHSIYGCRRLTRIDITENLRNWSSCAIPWYTFVVSNFGVNDPYLGVIAYYSADFAYISPTGEPIIESHTYHFVHSGWNYISMPLYIKESSDWNYPHCYLTDIFNTPADAWVFIPEYYTSGYIQIPRNEYLDETEPLTGMTYADILRQYSFLIYVYSGDQTVEGIPIYEQRYLDNFKQGYHFFGTTFGHDYVIPDEMDDLPDGSLLCSYEWDLPTGNWVFATTRSPFNGYADFLYFPDAYSSHLDLQFDFSKMRSDDSKMVHLDEESISEFLSDSSSLEDYTSPYDSSADVRRLRLLQKPPDKHLYYPPAFRGIPLPPHFDPAFRKATGENKNSQIIEKIELSSYPNPFNSSCRITAQKDATINIYDIRGNIVKNGLSSLLDGNYIWQPDKSVTSGVYLIRAESKGKTATKRILLIR